jgi:hypothetical protein
VTPVEEPRVAAARARAVQEVLAASAVAPMSGRPGYVGADPLRLCVYATVSLLAWCLSPALVAAVFGGVGFVAYARAWRRGLRKSDCVLGDPRWVMLYLGCLAVSGLAWTVWRLTHLIQSWAAP